MFKERLMDAGTQGRAAELLTLELANIPESSVKNNIRYQAIESDV